MSIAINRYYSKYRNRKTEVDGITFDSKREAARYSELKLCERAGLISELKTQVRYRLEVNGHKICDYLSDFQYVENGALVVEDTKGFATPAYKLKRKLMLALHGIVIRET